VSEGERQADEVELREARKIPEGKNSRSIEESGEMKGGRAKITRRTVQSSISRKIERRKALK